MERYYAELLEAPGRQRRAEEQAPLDAEPDSAGDGPLATLQRLVWNRAVAGMLTRQDDLKDLEEAYLNGGARQKIADWVDPNCVLSVAEVEEKMEANDWAAARAGLQPKRRVGGGSG